MAIKIALLRNGMHPFIAKHAWMCRPLALTGLFTMFPVVIWRAVAYCMPSIISYYKGLILIIIYGVIVYEEGGR